MFEALTNLFRVAPALMRTMPEVKLAIAQWVEVFGEIEQALSQTRVALQAMQDALDDDETAAPARLLTNKVASLMSDDERREFERTSSVA